LDYSEFLGLQHDGCHEEAGPEFLMIRDDGFYMFGGRHFGGLRSGKCSEFEDSFSVWCNRIMGLSIKLDTGFSIANESASYLNLSVVYSDGRKYDAFAPYNYRGTTKLARALLEIETEIQGTCLQGMLAEE
jgi:hypothetical protein